jgi:hypothetical protein
MVSIMGLGTGLQIAASFFIYAISPVVVAPWIGRENYIDGPVLAVFTLNYLVTCVTALPAQFVLASGRNPFAVSTLLHGVLTVIGIVWLCPRIGLLGVPTAGLIAVALTNMWLNPLEGWRTWKALGAAA